MRNTIYSDRRKHAALRQLGQLHTIRGCEWAKLKQNVLYAPGPWHKGPRSLLSGFYYSKNIQSDQILQAVFNDTFFGLCMVDLDTPEELKKSFLRLNVGTIFTRIVVEESMLESDMLKHGV